MKPTVIVTREKNEWVASATVSEDKQSFSAARGDSDPQVAVYKALHELYSDIATHYKSQFMITVVV
jgi:hypothetical protein